MPTLLTTGWIARTTHVGETIQLADTPPGGHVIDGHVFEDCVLIGPAVITFVAEATWDAPTFIVSHEDAAFWAWPATKFVKPDGVIAFGKTTFRRCRFEYVTVAGSVGDITLLRNAVSHGVHTAPPVLGQPVAGRPVAEQPPPGQSIAEQPLGTTRLADSWPRWAARWQEFMSVVDAAIAGVGGLNGFDATIRFSGRHSIRVEDPNALRSAVDEYNRRQVESADITIRGAREIRVSVQLSVDRGAALDVVGADATLTQGVRKTLSDRLGHFEQRPNRSTGAVIGTALAMAVLGVTALVTWRLGFPLVGGAAPGTAAALTVWGLLLAALLVACLRVFLPTMEIVAVEGRPAGHTLRALFWFVVGTVVFGLITSVLWAAIGGRPA